jgi:hypothetical protein
MKGSLRTESSMKDNTDRPKFCVYCGMLATEEAFFDVGNGVIALEKYCHICNGRVNLRLGAPSYHHGMMTIAEKPNESKAGFNFVT